MTVTSKPKTDNVDRARGSWGEGIPEWVIALAEACNRESQAAIARRIDYSSPTVSQVLSNSYPGDMSRFEAAVRGALMAETVTCPAQGAIAINVCLVWQKKPFDTTNSFRIRMYQACRNGCPHSRIPNTQNDTGGENP